jgi:hypothetical protein
MTTHPRHPARPGGEEPLASGPGPESGLDKFAVSPGLGPLPAIYVPRSPGQADYWTLARRAAGRAARLIRGRGARRPEGPGDLHLLLIDRDHDHDA